MRSTGGIKVCLGKNDSADTKKDPGSRGLRQITEVIEMRDLGERDTESMGGIKVGDSKKKIQRTLKKVRAVMIQEGDGGYR